MKFIIKLFPEITIKSQSVRIRFIKILTSNIRNVLSTLGDDITVVRHWDNIVVVSKDESKSEAVCDALTRIPGIHHFLQVEEHSYTDLHNILNRPLLPLVI